LRKPWQTPFFQKINGFLVFFFPKSNAWQKFFNGETESPFFESKQLPVHLSAIRPIAIVVFEKSNPRPIAQLFY